MFDTECLLCPQFNHCNVVRNFYLSTRSSELLAKVDVLKDMLFFRDHPNQCIGLLRLPLPLSVFALHDSLSVCLSVILVF